MKLLDMNGGVYDAETAKLIADQLTKDDQEGWTYIAEIKDKFGRVQAFDENGKFVGYF